MEYVGPETGSAPTPRPSGTRRMDGPLPTMLGAQGELPLVAKSRTPASISEARVLRVPSVRFRPLASLEQLE
jgi:hypothetical protein